MPRRYLFTLGRRPVLLYLCTSIIATLVLFRIFKGIILNRANNAADSRHQKRRTYVPSPKPMKEFQHGSLRSFKERPIITKIECEGDTAYNRICKFSNICYSPNTDRFFALTVDEKGLRGKWMNDDDNRLLDLTTVDDHNIFYFEFDENPGNALRELERTDMLYMSVSKQTFIFSRFVYNNIMHNIHDDFIGQYILHKQNSGKSSNENEIDTNNFIFFTDSQIENPNDHLFATLSKYPFMYREDIKRTKPNSPPICFENAIVGNSKDGIWYDYGFFDEPQGPISKKPLTGKYVKEAADFLRKYYDISLPSRLEVNKILKRMSKRTRKETNEISSSYFISIFSRTKDRLLLNERDLLKKLERKYGLTVRLVQLENLKFDEIIGIMSKTLVSIGLHGSALVFAMFMPENSILIELFPYGVPGENYSPYRTLAWLPEMGITYKMWINRNATMNYSQLGIRKSFDNLTPEVYMNIISLKTVPPHLCCGNLPWVVRIYQDTVVNVPEIIAITGEAISESLSAINGPKHRAQYIAGLLEMSRHRVKDVSHRLYEQKSFIGNDKIQMFNLTLNWSNPWEPINQKPVQYGVWIEEMLEEIIVKGPNLNFEACAKGSDINVWIRPYGFDKASKQNYPAAVFSKRFTFKCE